MSWLRMRLSTTAIDLPPNTTSPVAAYAIVEAQENTSAGGPTLPPEICSGAM